jgi:hypothetical protein
MDDRQLTLLVPKAARDAHAQLLAALGTENNPAQWMVFMDTVTKLLPDVLSAGRPTKEAVQRCAIGQLGFASWQAMVEAPTEAGGLAWNFSGWKAWRRAWGVVQEHAWLREQPLSSSQVNNMANNYRRWGRPFPASSDEFAVQREEDDALQEQARQESAALLKAQLAEAQQELAAARGSISALKAQLDEVLATGRADAVRIEQLQLDRDGWLSRYEALSRSQHQPLSRWQHLRAFFTGREN